MRFRQLAREMRGAAAARDDIGFMRLDRAFNQLVAAAARNEFAVKTAGPDGGPVAALLVHAQPPRSTTCRSPRRPTPGVAEAIAPAATPERCRGQSDRLMDHIETITRSAVDW